MKYVVGQIKNLNLFKALLLSFIFVNVISVVLSKAHAGPARTTYQAKIVKPDGYPLEAANVNFKFTILDPAGACILYSETYSSVNMVATGGLISFALGSGVKTYPVSATTFEQVFSNITPALSCDLGGPLTYTPAAVDARKIVMQFHDGTGWQTLPAMTINAVPYAMYANQASNLNGKTDTDFVQVANLATCGVDEALHYNGAGFTCVSLPTAEAVSAAAVVSALGYTPATGASVTALTSSLSTTASTLASVSSSVFSVSSTVSSLANSVSTLQSTVAASFSAITSSQWVTSGTNISYDLGSIAVSGGVRIGIDATTCSAGTAGTLRYNAGVVEYCNGLSWEAFGVAGAGISLINGSTSGTQTFVTGISGNNFNITSSNGIHSFNIPFAASASVTAGLLSNADYVLFSNKVNATSASVVSALGFTPANVANNLSDLTNASSARMNLGLGGFATVSSLDLGSASATGTIALARLPISSNISSGTEYTKVIVDGYGRVTSGGQLSVTDVTSALGYTPASASAATQWLTSGSTISYSSGNVGIGTTNPSGLLELSKNIDAAISFNMTNSSSGASSRVRSVYSNGTNSLTIGQTGTAFTANGSSKTDGSYMTGFGVGGLSIGTSHASGDLRFYTAGNLDSNERMRILSSGNVGIGTTAPFAKLDVSGAIRISMDTTTCAVSNAGTIRYNTGNVEYCNGTTWSAFGVAAAGLNLLNGSSSQTQTFANSLTGTTPAFLTANGVHTLNIPLASAGSVTAGLISNADYVSFSNKITSSAASIAQVLGYVPASATALNDYLLRSNNLSDLTNASTARTNLGLGGFATVSSLDLGSASATGILAETRLPSFANITSGTQYTKVTVDGKGRVTSGTQLDSSDVTTALGYTPANASAATQWVTSGTTISYISGKVGVGTSNPVANLDVLQPNGSTIGLRVQGFANNTQPTFQVVGGSSANTRIVSIIDAASNELFSIDRNGNIGILTSATSNTIGINGETARIIAMERRTVAAANGQNLTVGAGGSTVGGTDRNGGNLILAAGTATGTGSSSISFQTSTASTTGTADNTPTTKMTITGVGVGINTPSTNGLPFQISASSPTVAYSSNSLSLSAPHGLLMRLNTVGNSDESLAGMYFAGNDAGGTSQGSYFGALTSPISARSMDFVWGQRTNANAYAERMRLNNLGNLGIGTTTPVTRLDVSGAIRISMETATCAVSYAGSLRYNSGVLEMCNGTAWSALGMATAGLNLLNGSSSQTQTFANSLTGTTPAFLTANGVHTLNIPLASAGSATAGLISNADYVSFSNKITSSAASVAQVLGYVPASATALGNYLLKSNNLSDLTNASTARTNLGLGGFATVSSLDLGSASATGTIALARLPTSSNVTSGTQYTKVTVDGYGRVTSGGQLSTTDVTTALGYTPVSAAAATQWITSGTSIGYTTGAVGIGTLNPALDLDVIGRGRFGATGALGVPLTGQNDLMLGTGNSASGFNTYLALGRTSAVSGAVYIQGFLSGGSGAKLLLNSNGGNVGIGTVNPNRKLYVFSNDGGGNGITIEDTTAPILHLRRDAANEWFNVAASTTNTLEFRSGNLANSSTLTLNANTSNVGIGTNTPITRLDVSGAIRISMEFATCAVSYAGTLRYNSGNLEMCNGTAWSAFGVAGAGLNSLNGLTSATQTFANALAGTTPAFASLNGVHTLNIPLASAGSVTAGLISNADYVSFSNKITSSAASIAQALGYVPASATALNNYLLRSNNLSDLASSASARTNLGLGGFATASSLDLGSASATGTIALARLPAAANVTSGTQYTKVTVDGYGRVTSGGQLSTSDVTTALGFTPVSAAAASQWNTSGTTINYMTGNVGIGTATPAEAVDVSGSLQVTGSIKRNGVNLIGVSGTSLFVGDGSGVSTTTTGINNVGVGYRALNLNTTGATNVAVGAFAQASNLDATNNTAIGARALHFNISGGSNVAVGGFAMRESTSGARNVAIGYSSLREVSGTDNVVIGYNALGTSTVVSGSYNIVIGSGQTLPNLNGSSQLNIGGALYGNLNFGFIGIGVSSPIARLQIASGTANYAPLKFTSGTLLTSPQSGSVEYDGFNFYVTDGTNTRRSIALTGGTNSGTNTYTGNNTFTEQTFVSNNTASTNSTTGALIVSGGVGVGGAINAAGNITSLANIQGVSITATSGVSTTVIIGVPNLALNPSGGNVGVGTRSPSTELHIHDGVGSTADFKVTNSTTGISSSDGLTMRMSGSDASFKNYENGFMSFETNNNEKMRILSNGNVGIGITSAGVPLDVAGAVRTSGEFISTGANQARYIFNSYGLIHRNDGVNYYMLLTNSGDQYGTWNSLRPFSIETATGNTRMNNLFTSAASSSVGINTTSPNYLLDVNGPALIRGGAAHAQVAPGYGGTFFSFDSGTNTAGLWSVNNTTSQFAFYTKSGNTDAGTERMRIAGNGNVGIGTSAPTSVLHVNSSAAAASSGQTVLTLGGNQTSTAGTGPKILFENFAGTDTAAIRGYTFSGAETGLAFDTGWSVPTTKMVIDNSGNVGIGTTSPSRKLSVVSNNFLGAEFIVDASSNNVTSSVGLPILLKNKSASAGNYSAVGFVDANDNFQGSMGMMYGAHSAATQGSFYIEPRLVGTPSAFVVAPTGNVGIGTTNPNSRLSIHQANGTANDVLHLRDTVDTMDFVVRYNGTNGYEIRSEATGIGQTYLSFIGPTGNVGIGTSAPTQRLEVNGSVLASAYLYTSDRRLKKDFTPLEHSLDKLSKLSTVKFNWITPLNKDEERTQIGLIAQDVQKQFPEAVKKDEQGWLRLNYTALISPIIAAIQELSNKWSNDSKVLHATVEKQAREIASVKEENAKVKKENEEIKARLERLEKLMTK